MKLIFLLAFTGKGLASNRLAGYEPHTNVIDENNIDLDQREIEARLALGTNVGYDSAIQVYRFGAHAASFARLTVQPLQASLTVGDFVTGNSQDGSERVRGMVLGNYPRGKQEIDVKYWVNETLNSFCQVGGNPVPITDGCLMEDGTLSVEDGDPDIQYTYDLISDNMNQITIQKLSTQKRDETASLCKCDTNTNASCMCEDFNRYLILYGVHSYADKWFEAARLGKSTNFYFGNADFSTFGLEGKSVAMTTSTLILHIWMHVIYLMEKSVGDCEKTYIDKDGIHSWDQAVAFYTGSLEGNGSGGQDTGFLLNQLANKFCKKFKTCGIGGKSLDGEAFVNSQVLKNFKGGLSALRDDSCSEALQHKSSIAQLMLIPLVQGTLLNAYSQFISADNTRRDEASGATFGASILPYVHHCNPNDATIISDLVGASSERTGTDFPKVKAALERNYKCMGLQCSDIGGIWDKNSDAYYPYAGVCSDEESHDSNQMLGIALAIGGAVFLSVIIGIFYVSETRGRNGNSSPQTKKSSDDIRLDGVPLDSLGTHENDATDAKVVDDLPEFT